MLTESRAGVARLSPAEVVEAWSRGALVVDTRTEAQRRRQGELPGAVVIDRTVLEWRLDPASEDRIPEATDRSDGMAIMAVSSYGLRGWRTRMWGRSRTRRKARILVRAMKRIGVPPWSGPICR